jgi:hypothetical protein
MGFQKGAVAARLVGAAAEQRDSAGRAASLHLRNGRLRFGPREPGEIARHVLLPGDLLVQVGAQQLGHGSQLLEPDAHALLADAAGPEPHDEHALAVVAGGPIVDTLGDDLHVRLARSP